LPGLHWRPFTGAARHLAGGCESRDSTPRRWPNPHTFGIRDRDRDFFSERGILRISLRFYFKHPGSNYPCLISLTCTSDQAHPDKNPETNVVHHRRAVVVASILQPPHDTIYLNAAAARCSHGSWQCRSWRRPPSCFSIQLFCTMCVVWF
jgi:hypothetical protein